jgi:serine/threonine-protein kinase
VQVPEPPATATPVPTPEPTQAPTESPPEETIEPEILSPPTEEGGNTGEAGQNQTGYFPDNSRNANVLANDSTTNGKHKEKNKSKEKS